MTPMTDEVASAREWLARIESAASRHETKGAGRRIVWRRFGEGPSLVLLHGGHGNWMHWVRNIASLSQRHTLWLPDMPSYGDSDDLDVAARLAARGLVRRLALIGPAGHGGPRPPSAALVDWRTLPPSEQPAALRHNVATLMLHDPASIDALALVVYETQLRTSRFISKAISRTGGLQAALAAHAGPALLVWGEHDITAVPHELAPRLAAGCRDAAWRVVEGAGHWAQYERAEEVSLLLAQWFSGPATAPCASP